MFNFAFNERKSCLNKKYKKNDLNLTQATYIFLVKFKGNLGLIKYLKSGFGNVREIVFPQGSVHYTNQVRLDDDTIGIRDDCA